MTEAYKPKILITSNTPNNFYHITNFKNLNLEIVSDYDSLDKKKKDADIVIVSPIYESGNSKGKKISTQILADHLKNDDSNILIFALGLNNNRNSLDSKINGEILHDFDSFSDLEDFLGMASSDSVRKALSKKDTNKALGHLENAVYLN